MKINQLVNECFCSMYRLSFSGIYCVRDHEIKLLARHLLKRNMVLCSQCHNYANYRQACVYKDKLIYRDRINDT